MAVDAPDIDLSGNKLEVNLTRRDVKCFFRP